MRRLLLGGFGLGFGIACLSKLITPPCEMVEPEACAAEEEIYLRTAADRVDRDPNPQGVALLNRTVKDSVWTAGVAHSPMKTF